MQIFLIPGNFNRGEIQSPPAAKTIQFLKIIIGLCCRFKLIYDSNVLGDDFCGEFNNKIHVTLEIFFPYGDFILGPNLLCLHI